MSCKVCQKTHFTVAKVRRVLTNPSAHFTGHNDRSRLDLEWIAAATGISLKRGINSMAEDYYFFLDCRYLDYVGSCHFGKHQVAGDKARPYIAKVRNGKPVGVVTCDDDLNSEKVVSDQEFYKGGIEHYVRLDGLLDAYNLLDGDFNVPCADEVKALWRM